MRELRLEMLTSSVNGSISSATTTLRTFGGMVVNRVHASCASACGEGSSGFADAVLAACVCDMF